MQQRSALARLQQATTLGLATLATAWLVWQWPHSHVLALAGFGAIAFGYAIFLAAEFVALHFVGGDPGDRPGWRALFRAWAGEVVSAPRVFCWRQPFRWRAVSDVTKGAPGKRGVVLLHGFVCNRGLWTPWLDRLRDAGHPFIALNLEPVFGSIDAYAASIDAAVAQIAQSTGMPPILVCHSMGGLAARAWLRAAGDESRVHHVVTIASPHRGTWLGKFSHLTNGRQMRLAGEWVAQLARDEPGALYRKFTCWYTDCDNIVFPVSTGTLPAADNRLVRGVAHVHLAFDRRVMDETLALIAHSGR